MFLCPTSRELLQRSCLNAVEWVLTYMVNKLEKMFYVLRWIQLYWIVLRPYFISIYIWQRPHQPCQMPFDLSSATAG